MPSSGALRGCFGSLTSGHTAGSTATFSAMGVLEEQGVVHQPHPSCVNIHGQTYHHILLTEMRGSIHWYIHDQDARDKTSSLSKQVAHVGHPGNSCQDQPPMQGLCINWARACTHTHTQIHTHYHTHCHRYLSSPTGDLPWCMHPTIRHNMCTQSTFTGMC